MPRRYGNIFTSIWRDPEFRSLPGSAQRTYVMLFSQPDLSACGVLPLQPGRWARYCTDTSVNDINADLKLLEQDRFVLIDEDTGELAVRSLMKADKAYNNPKRLPGIVASIDQVFSPQLCRLLKIELRRLRDTDTARGPETGEPTLFDGPADTEAQRNTLSDTHADRRPDTHPDTQADRQVARTRVKDLDLDLDLDLERDLEREREEEPSSAIGNRDDVERLCTQLADRIEANGVPRPTIGKSWRDAARLMLDRDKISESRIGQCIDWATNDEFWRTNILSMPTLRRQFTKLTLAAQRQQRTGHRADGLIEHNGQMLRRDTIEALDDVARFEAMDAAIAAGQRPAIDTGGTRGG